MPTDNLAKLDPRAVKRVSGESWDTMRAQIHDAAAVLMAVSPTAQNELTTIYVKFTTKETGDAPYAVMWIKSSKELTIGFSLPEDYAADGLGDAPKGCKYGGLTRYFQLANGGTLPSNVSRWSEAAYLHAKATSNERH